MEDMWFKTKVLLTTFTHFEKRSKFQRYSFAIAITCSVLIVKAFMYPYLYKDGSFLLLSLVVVVSSWYGGLGPGLLSTLIATIINYDTYLIDDGIARPKSHDVLLSSIFILEGLGISILSEARYESDQQKDDFISYLAHELKNPLSAIIGFSTLIAKKAKNTQDEKIVHYSEIIEDSSNKLVQIVNDLLDISKIEIGKFSYYDSFFNLTDLTKEIITQQQVITKNREIILKGKSNTILNGDRYRIGQVITNLLTNAIKYSPENKKIYIRLSETRNNVLLSVKDYGKGISKKDQKKIFNRFYRTSNEYKSKSEGLGLGLYICFQIVKRHKGKLWIKSIPKKGSTFFMQLPLKKEGTKTYLLGII